MCYIREAYTESKTYTGYKVVIVDKYGHYYSPFTGIRYKVGPVVAKDITALTSKYRTNSPIGRSKQMSGYTGVLVSMHAANDLLSYFNDYHKEFNYSVIQMTISNELKYGTMGIAKHVIVGKYITSIKSLK